MSRLILAFLVALCLPGAALAACPGVMADCPVGSNTKAEVAAIGLKADGVTSDDVALKALVDQCAAGGGRLVLPAGNILLTGAAQITLRTCHVEGTSATNAFGKTAGTTFLMTSTTTGPFICGSGFRLSGVNLYWPNQIDGVTVYPPFLTDDGTTICAHNTIDNVVVVNAYDFIKQKASGPGWGDWKFYNLTAWAVHDLFQMNTLGDSFAASVMRLTPGPWLDICSTPNACAGTVKAALDAASLNNSVLHVTAGPNVNFNIGQAESEAWRYGILIDAGGSLSQSKIDVAWDGTGTLIDASSGGHYTGGNQFRGSNTVCAHVRFSGDLSDQGNTPCFNMGANSELILDGFRNEAPRGDFLRISGGSATIRNSTILNVGSRNDGTDYYLVNATGVIELSLQNNKLTGTAGVHSHGVNTGTNVPLTMVIEGNSFQFFNDDVTIQAASNSPTRVIGNGSQVTAGAKSITISGPNQVVYSGNAWDKPPVATLGACGTGATISGGFAGLLTTGTGTSTCAFTLPWVPIGLGGGACVFTLAFGAGSNTVVTAGPAGTPPTWSLTFSAPYNNNVFYNCQGQQ